MVGVVVVVARLRDLDEMEGELVPLLGVSLYLGVPMRVCSGAGGVAMVAGTELPCDSDGRRLVQVSVMESEKRFLMEKADARAEWETEGEAE